MKLILNSYLQILLPLIASGISLLCLLIQFIQRTVKLKRRKAHSLLEPSYKAAQSQGRYRDEPDRSEEEGHLVRGDDDSDRLALHLTKVHTNQSLLELNKPRGHVWTVIVEIMAVAAELIISLTALMTHAWGHKSTLAAVGETITWAYIFTLVSTRLLLTVRKPNWIPNIWYHTACLYVVQWILIALLFRSQIIHPRSRKAEGLMIADFVMATMLAVVAVTSRKGNKAVVLEYEDDLEPSHEPLANIFSSATFGWVDSIVWQGYKKTFELSDVWNLAAKDKAAAVIADFRQFQKTTKLAWHLLKYFKRDLIIQAAWAMASGLFTFAPTLLLKAFLEYVEDPAGIPVNAAWFYMILLALSSCIKAITDGQALWVGRKICIRLRAVIVGEIYAKALRRKAAAGTDTVLGEEKKKPNREEKSSGSNQKNDSLPSSQGGKKDDSRNKKQAGNNTSDSTDSQVNVGTIINLMAVDSFKVSEISAYLHFLWGSTPVQLILCVVLLYRILGWSALASIIMMVLVMPLNLFIAKQFTKVQKKVMAATDVRIHTTNEMLQNIRIIKYFAWEQRFGQIVGEKREVELRALRNKYILYTSAATVWFGVPLLITFFSFLLYTIVEKRPLIPSVAFTALSLFGILRYPLDQLADMIAHVQESKVSVDRVEEFLNEDETEKYQQLLQNSKDNNGDPIIGFDKATLTWGGRDAQKADGQTAFRMIDMDIRFVVGRLNIIVGPTGSGKTSLLMALLGEMTLIQGSVYLPGGQSRETLREDPETHLTESIAYCAQQAWLANDTIKQNILFAAPLDETRYRSVITACALERDLEILDGGDGTIVGEKGITLSGGQKQRISLARALYCNSRHVLLDDCLSAVDSHTAKHIFEQCIMGPLMFGRTCILVTHNIALCVPRSRHVVALQNGKVSAQGSPEDVLSTGALGDDLLKSRPASRLGSQTHSRDPSSMDLKGEATSDTNGHIPEPNGHVNGEPKGPKTKDENANTRTEAKATGSVNVKVIKMYLVSMGPWHYWLLALAAFGLQQVGSVACNVWIRTWANEYTESIQRVGLMAAHTTSHLRGAVFSSNTFLTGTPFWNLPLSSKPSSSIQNMTSLDNKVDAWYYLITYAFLSLFYVFISLLREGYIFWGSLRASRKLHTRLLESVSRAKLQFFDTTPLGQLMNRFSKDIEAIDQDVAPVAVGVLGCFFSMISIVVLISVITPGFLIAGLFITIIYFAIGTFYLRSSRDLKRLESVQRSPLYQQFGETLSGIVTIRAYGDERRFVRDNQTRVDTHNRPFIYLWAANRWLALRVDFTGALVAFFAGVFVILSIGTIDAGSAGLSLTYAVMFTENVLWLVRLYAVNEQNMNSVERVKEYIEVEQEAKAIIDEARPAGNWPSQGAIQFMNYTTRYRPDLEPVLKDLTFSVQPGERVGIVGRTGAGKSSLALALFRGLEAVEGKIIIDDIDIALIGLQDLREAITIVPQDPTLFTGTVRSNLDPFGLFTDEAIFATLRRVHLIGPPTSSNGPPSATVIVPDLSLPPESSSSAEEYSDDEGNHNLSRKMTNSRENTNIFTDLSSPVAESGSNLSQGQRQLLCLARALLKAPRVLLMDEATASIDYATDSKIQNTLRDVKESTILTIAHRLQTIIDYDKVLVLDKGRVIEYDAPWDLISREGGIFRGMCEMSGDLEALTEGANKAAQKKKLIDV